MNRKGEVFYNDIFCGIIEETDNTYKFSYDEKYLNNKLNKPISATLPLRKEAYESAYLFPFFDGLIPEGYLLNLAIDKYNLKRTDRMGLLLSVSTDPIGAVSVKAVE